MKLNKNRSFRKILKSPTLAGITKTVFTKGHRRKLQKGPGEWI